MYTFLKDFMTYSREPFEGLSEVKLFVPYIDIYILLNYVWNFFSE